MKILKDDLTSMQSHVSLKSGGTREHDGADVALDVGGRTDVDPLVRLQRRLHRELLAALVASKRFLT